MSKVKSTTVRLPVALVERINRNKVHKREYHYDVIERALDALEATSKEE